MLYDGRLYFPTMLRSGSDAVTNCHGDWFYVTSTGIEITFGRASRFGAAGTTRQLYTFLSSNNGNVKLGVGFFNGFATASTHFISEIFFSLFQIFCAPLVVVDALTNATLWLGDTFARGFISSSANVNNVGPFYFEMQTDQNCVLYSATTVPRTPLWNTIMIMRCRYVQWL